MKLAITGHRPNKLGNDYELKSPLMLHIALQLTAILRTHDPRLTVNKGKDLPPLTLISGMALGIDQLFALTAIQLGLPFIAAIPCSNQEKVWPEKSQLFYKELLGRAQNVHVVSPHYTKWCMQARNEWMVNNCDKLIAVWDGSQGGTANCVKYAESVNKPIIYIKPTI